MKKIGILALALVMALGALGIGYAHWTDTLEIEGDINTGWVDVNFHSQIDNDLDSNDPNEEGNWVFPSSGGPPWWDGTRENKDVAKTSSTFSTWVGPWSSSNVTGNTAEMIITDGYPSYWGSVIWDIQNNGNIPVELWKVNLIAVDGPGAPWAAGLPYALEIDVLYYVDADSSGQIDQQLDAGDDFSFILSAHNVEQLDPFTDSWGFPKGWLDITIHVEQDAQMKSSYEFTIEYVFANWNEVPTP